MGDRTYGSGAITSVRMNTQMRILLADDHVLVRDTLKLYIEGAEPQAEVLTATDLDGAVELAAQDPSFDLVILDYRMPGMDGFVGLEKMQKTVPGKPVAILSGMANRDEVHEAISRGAAGFLPKTLSAPALIGAVNLIMSGERFVPVSSFEDNDELSTPAPQRLNGTDENKSPLTPRETDVLRLLHKGSSNKEIARNLDLKEVTIKLHVGSICRKLQAKNRTQAVLRAIELGMVP